MEAAQRLLDATRDAPSRVLEVNLMGTKEKMKRLLAGTKQEMLINKEEIAPMKIEALLMASQRRTSKGHNFFSQ